MFDYLVVIPTVGERYILRETLPRLLKHCDGARVRVVVSLNPVNEECMTPVEIMDLAEPPEGTELLVEAADGPLGFAGACNAGLVDLTDDVKTVVFINDDVFVGGGWLVGMRNALDSQHVRVYGEPVKPGTNVKQDRPAAAYGRIGMTGPASDNVAGVQATGISGKEAQLAANDIDTYAWKWRNMNTGNVMTCDFLSGFCIALDRKCFEDLVEREQKTHAPLFGGDEHPTTYRLFDECFGIGGFEDNDLCIRAEKAGWRCVVAADTFVHHRAHQTLDKHFGGQLRGLANRLVYYDKWAKIDPPANRQNLVACYRAGFTFANDIHYLKSSIKRASDLCNGIALLLTNNPLEVKDAYDWDVIEPTLSEEDKGLLHSCSKAKAPRVRKAMIRWVKSIVGDMPIRIDIWQGEWNERDERNAAIALAEELEPDWIFSIDSDELVEDSITRPYLERLMSHPDPMIRTWDCGWLNHWNGQQLVRVDPPWSDGERYRSGMRGFRLWRSSGRRILAGTANGLHCGNSPSHDVISCGVSSIRFRHFGYARPEDRMFKYQRYCNLDPNPDAALTGGGYNHLIHEENMRMSPYVARDRVGGFLMCHAKEPVHDIARHLDTLHGVCDDLVLVWTDEGQPSDELKAIAAHFGVNWVYHKLDFDLAACRNAAVDHFRGKGEVAWVVFFDPDEFLSDPFGDCISIRRMAECSDSYGFMFRFANHRPPGSGEPATNSECVRMFRLDPEGIMRFSGRVHEGFDRSLFALRNQGVHPQMRSAPFVVQHPGLGLSDEEMEEKLRRYTKMLVLELEENPNSPGAWMSLGLQYNNEGEQSLGLECLNRAVETAGEGYLPYKELAIWHLRQARVLYHRVLETLTPAHSYYPLAEECYRYLEQYGPPQPVVGLARVGKGEKDWIPPMPWGDDANWRKALVATNGGPPEEKGSHVDVLQRAGILDENGNLAERYRGGVVRGQCPCGGDVVEKDADWGVCVQCGDDSFPLTEEHLDPPAV